MRMIWCLGLDGSGRKQALRVSM